MSYLEQFDAAAPEDQFPLARKWLDEEPLPFFKELREFRPILETPKATLVARFRDVIDVLRKPTTFSVALYKPKMGDFMLSQDETPAGFRDKAVMQSMLNRDDIQGVRNLVAQAASDALAEADGEIEAVWGLGRAVPIKLVQDYFGFVGADPEKMFEWSYWNQMDAFHNQPFDIVDDADAIVAKREAALEEMKRFLAGLVGKRAFQVWAGAAPDDIASRIIRTSFPPSVGFTAERAIINIGGLLIGAVETTSQAAIQAAAYLLAQKDEIRLGAKSAAAQGPAAFDGYVWEALRFRPISPYMFRLAEQDATIGRGSEWETRIAKGAHVLPLVGSAMFDDDAYPDAEEFDPTRPLDNAFHLGWGHHECLGKYVALAMIPEIVRQIFLLEDVTAPAAPDYRGGPFPESWTLNWTT